MSTLDEIQEKASLDRFEFSKHAVDQSITRQIAVQEVREAIAHGEIIEDYPDDKFGPSVLVFGRTESGRPIHVHCTYPTHRS